MTRSLVVMQPAFMPWAGYFNLMAEASHFIFLDDLQLEKQSWQTRNRLVLGGEVRWVIVPVRNTHLTQSIMSTDILHDTQWREKLARGFVINYGRHAHYNDAREIIDFLVASTARKLAAFNEQVVRFIADRLQLAPQMHKASDLGIGGVRSARLAAFCERFNANEYLSPVGSAEYLREDRFTDYCPSTLRFQSFAPGQYPQRGKTEFQSHLSIVDVVANIGWEAARTYVRTGQA